MGGPPTQQTYGTGVVFVLLATLGWSLSGLFVRLMPDLNGWQLNCWRGFWMATALLCYLVLLHGPNTWKSFKAVPLPAMLLASGLFGIFVGDTLLFNALNRVGPRRSSILFALNAPMTAVLGWLLLGETLPEHAALGTELEIKILGKKFKSTVIAESPYDPENNALRA